MADFYQQNLAALRQNHAAIAARVESIASIPEPYRFLATKTQVPTLAVQNQDNETVYLYSRYDPLKEVERDLSSINHQRIYMPCLIGIGLGYALRLLWDRYREEFFDLLLLERDPYIFKMAMQTTRMDDIFSYPRTRIHLGEDLTEWPALVRAMISSIMSSDLQVIEHKPSKKLYTDYYDIAYVTLLNQVRLTKAEFDLMIHSGPLIQENVWLNVASAIASISLDRIRNAWAGKPAVVVAAGPSLDRNVLLLKDVQNHVPILCVDTAQRTLLQHGIQPHIVVTCDPTQLNHKHFEGMHHTEGTILAFDPEVFFRIPQEWPHRKLMLNLEKSILTRTIEALCSPLGYLQKGGSVGHTAFYLARDLGADPIILVGLDLAYDPAGGKSHSAAAALYRTHGAIQDGSPYAELGAMNLAASKTIQEDIVWVTGTHHPHVPTSRVMALYINQFVEEIFKTKAKVVDATEGGAKLEGTEILPLRDALSQYVPPSDNTLSTIAAWQPPERDRAKIRQRIAAIKASLDISRPVAERGVRLCESLMPRVGEGESLRNDDAWIQMEQCFQQLYHSEDLKIAIEQALFSAVYYFVKKEKPREVETRIQKYKNYFESFLDLQPEFVKRIQFVLDEMAPK